MARVRLFFVAMCMAVAPGITVNGQSKKEVIAMLSKKTDSLEKVIAARNEGIQKLEVKLARLEGAADAHNEVIKRIESRSDSLRDALTTKNTDVEALTAKVAALNAELAGLKTEQQEWLSRNDTLQAQLNAFAQSPPATSVGPKAVVASAQKQVATATTQVSKVGAKQRPVIPADPAPVHSEAAKDPVNQIATPREGSATPAVSQPASETKEAPLPVKESTVEGVSTAKAKPAVAATNE